MIERLEDLTVENLSLENIAQEIAHLSANDILQVIYDYKSEMTVKEILQKYSIDTKPSKLKMLLPLVLGGVCECCQGKILFELESKTYGSDLLKKQSGQCVSCGHEPYVFNCKCHKCVLLKNNEKKQAEIRMQNILKTKMEAIQKEYDSASYEKIEEDNLSFKEKICLSTILRCCLSEDGKYIKPIKSSLEPVTPQQELTTQIIRHLTASGILIPSANSDINAFIFDESNEPNSYYTYEVSYLLNVESNDKYSLLIERLLYLEIDISEYEEDFVSIWKDLAFYEVLNYFLNQMNEVGYEPTIGEITKATFSKLLENFSVGQIFNIIFRAVANSTRAYQSGEYTKKHAMNMVVASCRNQGERALAEKWDLKPYNRIKQLPESELSRLLFTSILKKPNHGFYNAPTLENLKKGS
ncbi:hypothetical protein [Acinetobacter bouvetii]|uniref:Uncharacterized protein n=1 Tax=Acinetobacter bouvetii TaxID=202951 RepID=A0A811G8A0_9GAMM|nr:hypothetical protein [Acinetobacter bouvetii]CAB1209901.1 hypothetical protein SFB21_0662 [Acinetobacter bouvetii]